MSKKKVKIDMYDIDMQDVNYNFNSYDERGSFIDIYAPDTLAMRKLLFLSEEDILDELTKKHGLVYGEDYDIDFYIEYYPHTEDVAIKMWINEYNRDSPDVFWEEIDKRINTKDNYILLTDEQKEALRARIQFSYQDDIADFLEIEEAEVDIG